MTLFGDRKVQGRYALDEMVRSIWPGARHNDDQRNNDFVDACYRECDSAILEELQRDRLSAWADNDSGQIKIPTGYFNSDAGIWHLYSGEIAAESEHGLDLSRYDGRPWYLLRTDFDQFKARLIRGDGAELVSLWHALHFLTVGTANKAAVMRWYANRVFELGLNGANQACNRELEPTLARMRQEWRNGFLRPFGRQLGASEDRFAPSQIAMHCVFLPLSRHDGQIVADEHGEFSLFSQPAYRWDNIRFLRSEIDALLLGQPRPDPLNDTYWTVQQCLAWIASRAPDGVLHATKADGLGAIAGAISAASGNPSAAYSELQRALRAGLTCLAIDRLTGVPDNIPLAQRAHIRFDMEHNAALINVEVRWHDLRFPVAEVLKIWPAASAGNSQPNSTPRQRRQSHAPNQKIRKALITYRATLGSELPLAQDDLRKKIGDETGTYMSDKPFRKLLREMDENRAPGEPALIRERGKKGHGKSAS